MFHSAQSCKVFFYVQSVCRSCGGKRIDDCACLRSHNGIGKQPISPVYFRTATYFYCCSLQCVVLHCTILEKVIKGTVLFRVYHRAGRISRFNVCIINDGCGNMIYHFIRVWIEDGHTAIFGELSIKIVQLDRKGIVVRIQTFLDNEVFLNVIGLCVKCFMPYTKARFDIWRGGFYIKKRFS